MADFSQVKLPDGTTYDVKDSVSGYITGITVDSSATATTNLVTSSSHPYDASTNALATMADIGAAGGGTVTSVGISNATDGGLSVSGSPVTSAGTITVGHSNVLTNAQTTQAVYPITIDKNGHISAYGDAVNQLFEVVVNDENGGLTVNKTYAQILDAYTHNKFVYATYTYVSQDGYTITMPVTFYDESGNGTIYFEALSEYGQYGLALNSSNTWTYFEFDFAPLSHTHGNIQSNGSLQPTDVTIATGDKLVVTDNSGSGMIARTSVAFDTTNTTQYLRKDGTWATPSGGTSTDVQINGTSITSSGTANIITNSTYNSSSNKIATMSDVKGSDVLLVTLSYSNSTYSIDSTYDDILQAVSDGKFVYLYDAVSSWSYSSDGGFIIAPLSLHYPYEPAEDEYYLYFVASYTAGGNVSFCRYSVDNNDGVWADNSVGVTSATSASSATSATNATNTYVTKTNPTSETTYYPVWANSNASGNRGLLVNNGLGYITLEGTTSADGYGCLIVGNSTASGTPGNKYGAMRMYGSTTRYTELRGAPVTANRTCHLPVLTATGYLLGKSSTTAVGSASQLVYFSADGIATAGMSVLSGTTAPTSGQGSNGDIYIRY